MEQHVRSFPNFPNVIDGFFLNPISGDKAPRRVSVRGVGALPIFAKIS